MWDITVWYHHLKTCGKHHTDIAWAQHITILVSITKDNLVVCDQYTKLSISVCLVIEYNYCGNTPAALAAMMYLSFNESVIIWTCIQNKFPQAPLLWLQLTSYYSIVNCLKDSVPALGLLSATTFEEGASVVIHGVMMWFSQIWTHPNCHFLEGTFSRKLHLGWSTSCHLAKLVFC